jgi:hypothetical protein
VKLPPCALAGSSRLPSCAPGRRREALAALAPKGGPCLPIPRPGADRGEPTERPERIIGDRAEPDLRVLPRDTGGLLYRWFLLYRQDIQRV